MKKVMILFTLILLILCQKQFIHALGVEPLSVDLELKQGDTNEFYLTILPKAVEQIIAIEVVQPKQRLDGSIAYVFRNESEYEVFDWISVQDKAVVPPNEYLRIPVSINVPFGVVGSHPVFIMLQEVKEEKPGFQLRVRYLVRVNIDVPQPWLRENMHVIDFNFATDAQGRPQLIAHIKNPSELLYGAYGEVAIRDENRRLVERVELRTALGTMGTRIYPGAEVQFKGIINAPLFTGDYDLRLFMRYADGRQASQSMQISVGDEYLTAETLRYLKTAPGHIYSSLRSGGSNTSIIELINQTGEILFYEIEAVEIFTGYENSIFSELDFQIRSSGRNIINSRGSDRLMTMVRAPREVKDGGYYGNIEIKVFSQDGKPLESHKIELETVVGTDNQTSLELRDLSVFPDPDKPVMSLSVRNTGNIAFAPRATAYIYNENGEIIRTITLTLSEDINRILPAFSGFLVGDFENIYEGIYEVMVKAELAGDTLAESQFIVEIEENGGDL